MNKISTTYIASGAAALTLVLPLLGIQVVDEGSLTQAITEIVGALALFYTFYGRWKAGGINAFGLKK